MKRFVCIVAAALLSLCCACCVWGCTDAASGGNATSGIAANGGSAGGSGGNANAASNVNASGGSSGAQASDGVQANVRPQTQRDYYKFRNNSKWTSHYKKHGIDMGFKDKEEYLDAANKVISNPATLHKFEAEDHDDVYYLEKTREFVVVSGDGYIRTYYNASRAYFDRQ